MISWCQKKPLAILFQKRTASVHSQVTFRAFAFGRYQTVRHRQQIWSQESGGFLDNSFRPRIQMCLQTRPSAAFVSLGDNVCEHSRKERTRCRICRDRGVSVPPTLLLRTNRHTSERITHQRLSLKGRSRSSSR